MESESEETINNQDKDVCSELESTLKLRNKVICRKEITLPYAHIEDTDLSDVLGDAPKIKPNKHLIENERSISSFMENIIKLKRTSELEIEFDVSEKQNQVDEVSQTLSRLRQQSEKLFKRMINTQVGFNECLSNNLITNNLEIEDHIKTHSKLIEQTCKFDRGVESILDCNKDKLGKHVKKNLKVKSINEFKEAYTELANDKLRTIYEAAMKTFKNHEHLLAIKQFNNTETEIMMEDMESEKLDPYSRQLITKPVKNKICQHVYDQNSIDQMFNKKLFISCPYIGCRTKRFTKKDLLYDLGNSCNSD